MHFPKYYAVLGKGDYLTINGKRRGIWEYLEQQPSGWLCSVAVNRAIVPRDLPIFWDCGAVKYRNAEIPVLGKTLVTPAWAIAQYQKNSPHPGDLIAAPDHILIPGSNLRFRRRFNLHSAKEFLNLARQVLPECTPIAVTHGITAHEKIKTARNLYELGYRAIGIGGMAINASDIKGNIASVAAIRDSLPHCYIHVFGLCSPVYAKAWFEIGIDSFDGSSYLLEAFKGRFYKANGRQITKYIAALPGDKITIPLCYCRPCTQMRQNGIEARASGSRFQNLTRAAHNLGQLLLAQTNAIVNRRIGLIACVSKKRKVTSPASELYISQWFQAAKKYILTLEIEYFILSTKHGILHPTQMVEPYDQSLYHLSAPERRRWSEMVVKQLIAIAPPGTEFIILAGKRYREGIVEPLLKAGYNITIAMQGLGIGQQLQWLAVNTPKEKQLSLSLLS
ncbi:MAG TPA: hypothetical protein DDW76_05560 [Cyanobacteria bacterium UBA11369]|nr:hypothetical protein [Cyanobacteria bacterium UBA11371]HBE36686.1 hypothetical protein [Cyanobacteria bacterium UBA11368]HBE48273.1 hypothetical protein [Cyanobacteria bacterium UBA11369]